MSLNFMLCGLLAEMSRTFGICLAETYISCLGKPTLCFAMIPKIKCAKIFLQRKLAGAGVRLVGCKSGKAMDI